jgi:hypothetical protein
VKRKPELCKAAVERCSDDRQWVAGCSGDCIYGSVIDARNSSWPSKLSVAFLLDAALVFGPMKSDLQLQQWIEREFAGYGVAIRGQSEQTIPGEPLMSMAVAKDLTRRAVATFGSINATERQDTADVGVIELPPFPFHREA